MQQDFWTAQVSFWGGGGCLGMRQVTNNKLRIDPRFPSGTLSLCGPPGSVTYFTHNQVWATTLGLRHLIFHLRILASFPLTQSTVPGMCQADQLISLIRRKLGLYQ